MNNNTNLSINTEQFELGYNLDFTAYIESDYQNITYVPWSNARVLLKKHFPNLEVGYDEPIVVTNNSNQDNAEYTIKHAESLRNAVSETNDKREKKKLSTALDNVSNILIYKDRGLMLQPYLFDVNTGARSVTMPFPVMDSTNNFIPSPTARDISDANVRGGVKAIAYITGIGLRLWSRELIDLARKNDNGHPIYKGLIAINTKKIELLTEFGYLPAYWENPDFSWSLHRLRSFNRRLKEFNGETIDEQTGIEINEETVIADGWKTPMQAMQWAITQGMEKTAATKLITSTPIHREYYKAVKEILKNA